MLKFSKEEKKFINCQIQFFKFLKLHHKKLCRILSSFFNIKDDCLLYIGSYYDNEYIELLINDYLFFVIKKSNYDDYIISKNNKESYIIKRDNKYYKFFKALMN